jgi:hypothetical protein
MANPAENIATMTVRWRVAQLSASRQPLIAPRIDFAGTALFALFFSAKGAGLDPAFKLS